MSSPSLSAAGVPGGRAVPAAGVPGPGRTSGLRSGWSKSSCTASCRVSESRDSRSAHAGPWRSLPSARAAARRIAIVGASRVPRSARSPSGASPAGGRAVGALRVTRYSFGAAIATITARLEISAMPAPVRPIRGSRISVRPRTRTQSRPCSQAIPEVLLCARCTAKYVSMTTRSSAPTANQRSSGVAASAYAWPNRLRMNGAARNRVPHTGSMIIAIRRSAARVLAASSAGSCAPSTVSEAPMLMASRLTVPPMVVVM
ncbi:hypothetical protein [Streptomyces alfalfae]